MSGASPFGFEAQPGDAAVEVVVTGDLDTYSGPLLVDRIVGVLDDGAPAIKLDLARVTFMDSAGLYALESCRRAADDRSARLTLLRPAVAVQTLLDMTGFARVLDIEPAD